MEFKNKCLTLLFCLFAIIVFSSCIGSTNSGDDLSDSLDPVEEVEPIAGSENTTIIVNQSSDFYFSIGITGIQNNSVIEDGMVREGWCIDWEIPIDSNNGSYENVQLFSTYNVEKWNPLNYLFNIMDDLKQADSELTFREFQIVIWSLRGQPEFNLNEIQTSDLPSRLRNNGEPNFNIDKVNTILEIIEKGHEDFEFTEGTRFAVIAETPPDVQTVITIVN